MSEAFSPPTLTVDTERILGELETLAGFSDATAPSAVTRVLWTERDMQARNYLIGLFTEAGLTVRVDPLGNTFARWIGTDPDAPAVGTGSHVDAIPESGRYDGTVGVLGALEAFRALRKAGFVPERSLEILLFTSEEPTRFGLGCLGSRVLSGTLSPEKVGALPDKDGRIVNDVRQAAGFSGSLHDVRLPDGYYEAFVELHIEQGPLLERQHIDIGVVTAIAAPATLRVTLTGEGGHAGAVLMPDRRDALLAAAEIALAVEKVAKSSGNLDTVATTGVLRVYPGAVNSIPSRIEMEIDIRDTDLQRRDHAVEEIQTHIEELSNARGIASTVLVLNADPPALCALAIVDAVTEAVSTLNLSLLPMVSRAYHDSLFMARIAPTGMIFIPCRNGVSHRPDEYSSPEQIINGVGVLAHTLARLSVGKG